MSIKFTTAIYISISKFPNECQHLIPQKHNHNHNSTPIYKYISSPRAIISFPSTGETASLLPSSVSRISVSWHGSEYNLQIPRVALVAAAAAGLADAWSWSGLFERHAHGDLLRSLSLVILGVVEMGARRLRWGGLVGVLWVLDVLVWALLLLLRLVVLILVGGVGEGGRLRWGVIVVVGLLSFGVGGLLVVFHFLDKSVGEHGGGGVGVGVIGLWVVMERGV